MNRGGRAAVMLAVGAILGSLLWTGSFGSFVQQRMEWPLIIATAVLLVFGAFEAFVAKREEQDDPESARRSRGPVVGWLLILPMVVLVSVAPTALGASAADRVEAYSPTETSSGFDVLDDSDGPVELRVFDFLNRAVWDTDESLDGVTVRLEGLVVNDDALTDGFKLTRFLVSCCAADGIPLQVSLHGVDGAFENDAWVSIDLVWRSPDVPYQDTPTPWIVEADVVSISVIDDPPDSPYESPF